jgi:hypothetical protein
MFRIRVYLGQVSPGPIRMEIEVTQQQEIEKKLSIVSKGYSLSLIGCYKYPQREGERGRYRRVEVATYR